MSVYQTITNHSSGQSKLRAYSLTFKVTMLYLFDELKHQGLMA